MDDEMEKKVQQELVETHILFLSPHNENPGLSTIMAIITQSHGGWVITFKDNPFAQTRKCFSQATIDKFWKSVHDSKSPQEYYKLVVSLFNTPSDTEGIEVHFIHYRRDPLSICDLVAIVVSEQNVVTLPFSLLGHRTRHIKKIDIDTFIEIFRLNDATEEEIKRRQEAYSKFIKYFEESDPHCLVFNLAGQLTDVDDDE